MQRKAWILYLQFLYIPMDFPQKEFIRSQCPNLMEFADRMKAELWPQWDQMCKAEAMNGHRGYDMKD